MRIGLYNPYLSTVLGGGERHFLTIASCLSQNHQVELIFPRSASMDGVKFKRLINTCQKTFALDLNRVKMAVGPFDPEHSLASRWRFTRMYDRFYYMSDGSLFLPRAKKNIVHLQIPFKTKIRLIDRFKLPFWQVITANSQFTADWLDHHWGIKFDYVHRGSINLDQLKPGKKENIIINVGRFISGTSGKHSKRQDFLVRTFKKMCDKGLTGWRLLLIGPIEKGNDNRRFAKKVKRLARGYPIEINHHSDFDSLAAEYGKAKIYWHAAGYGVDQEKNPQAVEHLGLTTVEAQATGAVPIVINRGGQPEVVTHAVNGLLWDNQKQLIKQTQELIANPKLWSKLSRQAVVNARSFSYQQFCRTTKKIFSL